MSSLISFCLVLYSFSYFLSPIDPNLAPVIYFVEITVDDSFEEKFVVRYSAIEFFVECVFSVHVSATNIVSKITNKAVDTPTKLLEKVLSPRSPKHFLKYISVV